MAVSDRSLPRRLVTNARLATIIAIVTIGVVALGLAAADLAPSRGQAPPAPAATIPLSAPVPLDPTIIAGRLDNGLQYFIRANPVPEHRAELRLAVDAGSILEDDDQRGLAHFVEHMAFEGTTHFPGQSAIAFMQSLGMSMGAHVNAATTFDDTVFKLQVPTDRPGVLDRSLLILEDWAHNVTFPAAGVDRERGVITAEWRQGLGVGSRIQDQQFPVLLAGSRYAERLPIGRMDVVQNATPDSLRAFYTTWYRPDLMAVIVVGDVDKAEVERLIKAHFASLTDPPHERPRPAYTVPARSGTRYSIATDAEVTTTTVGVYSLTPAPNQTTVGAYRRQMIAGLFTNLLSARLAEAARRPDAPFLAAGAGRGLFVTPEEASTLTAIAKDGGLDRSLETLFAEAARAARSGFTATEIDRQKANVLASFERAVAEKDTQPSSTFADEFLRHFTTGEPVPGIHYEYELVSRFLPGVTPADLDAYAKAWMPDANRVVAVVAPRKPGVAAPEAGQLARDIADAAAQPLAPYVDTVTTTPLLDTTPTPGAIARRSTRAALGLTEWDLSNGVRVVLKPTTFKDDEILFHAFSLGGISLAPDSDLVPAETAAEVVYAGGAGRHAAADLQKELSGRVVKVQPFIGNYDEGLAGGASRHDLETMFELIYLRFTEPRADPAIFDVLRSQLRTVLASQPATPDALFAQTIQAALTQDNVRARPMTAADIDRMNLAASLAFYKARFADASRFTFVFVGSFEPAEIEPLVVRYLASLPATHQPETWRDLGIRPPTGIVTKTVEKGLEPKSRVGIVFTGPFEEDEAHRAALLVTARVLQSQLVSSLREGLGATYGVSVTGSSESIPSPEYRVVIDFTCSPDRAAALITRVFQDVNALRADGPTERLVGEVTLSLEKDFETTSRQNNSLLAEIANRYEIGEDPATFFGRPALFRSLSAAIIHGAAQKYLTPANYVQVTLLPAGG